MNNILGGGSNGEKLIKLSIAQTYLELVSNLGSAYVLRTYKKSLEINHGQFTNYECTGPGTLCAIGLSNSFTTATVVHEIYQVISPQLYHVLRIYPDQAYIQIEFQIGTIKPGGNLITRFTSSIDNYRFVFLNKLGRLGM